MTARVIHVDDLRDHPERYPDAVYIGRAVPRKGLKASKWANPYKIGPDGSRRMVIAKYRYRMAAFVRRDDLHELAGKPLACWCRRDGEARTPDNTCHGDVLVALIRELGLEDQP